MIHMFLTHSFHLHRGTIEGVRHYMTLIGYSVWSSSGGTVVWREPCAVLAFKLYRTFVPYHCTTTDRTSPQYHNVLLYHCIVLGGVPGFGWTFPHLSWPQIKYVQYIIYKQLLVPNGIQKQTLVFHQQTTTGEGFRTNGALARFGTKYH